MILSILDINRSLVKGARAYFCMAVFALVFDKIYSIFSHGVYSNYMDSMFLYPLIGGTFIYLLLLLFATNINYKENRLSFNIYNSGIAILTVGSLLHGILEIAGTSSEYILYYSIIGWTAVLVGIISFFVNRFREKKIVH